MSERDTDRFVEYYCNREKYSATKYADMYINDSDVLCIYPIKKFSLTEDVVIKPRDIELLKQEALESLNNISFDRCTKVGPQFMLNCYFISGIGRYNKFKDMNNLLQTKGIVTKEKIVEDMKYGYNSLMTNWKEGFNVLFYSHRCKTFKKYNLAYTLDENKIVSLYLYVGKKNGEDYFCLAQNFGISETIDLGRDFKEQDIGFDILFKGFSGNDILIKNYANTKYIKRTENMIPLDRKADMSVLKQIPEVVKKLEQYK